MRILNNSQVNLSAFFVWLLAGAVFIAPLSMITAQAVAQEDSEEDEDEEEETKTIEEFTEEFELTEGLFPLYRDPEDGSLYMEISEDQLGQEFIVYSHTENGVLQAGHFRGAYRDQRIVRFEKRYDLIDVIEENTSFYFDPESALSRAADANISEAIISLVYVDAETEAVEGDGDEAEGTPARYLVFADDLFLTEDLHQVKSSPNPDAPPMSFSLGELSGDKTRYAEVRNYPQNTDVIVDYVYENGAPMTSGGEAVTDARAVTIKMQHSILAMPDEGFEPRIDDYRVGYFLDRVTDLTSPSATPYRDLISRWRLVKKDPEKAISEPVKPITWWIENTTPVEYRDTIRNATLAWNQSFEAAGFKNAVEVKVQPDDADWDAGDIRYNVLRWTSSPIPPFGGYGPSFTNPHSGEILAADIMLEYVFLTNRLDYAKLYDSAAVQATKRANVLADPKQCDYGFALQQDLMFAKMAALQEGMSEAEQSELVKQGLYYLILHEVGHTLGLNHNMKASQLYGPREVHDSTITDGVIMGSVMDYPALNVAPLGMPQGDYANTRPGPYDDWAITFGYAPGMDDPKTRADHLGRSLEPALTFGNDADDMRASGGWGIDPRVMIGDMSSDMITYGKDRTDLVRDLMTRIKDKYAQDGETWQALTNAYLILTGQQSSMARSISRFIGGVYVERADNGQAGATQPFTPVSRARQEAAMAFLKNELFSADAFEIPSDLAAALQQQRRGFDFFGVPEDPKIHERASAIQGDVLNHLMSPVVLGRMTNYQVYGGDYSAAEMLLDLNDAVFGDDLTGSPNTFRQNLQVLYTEQMISIFMVEGYDSVARSAALGAILDINRRIGFMAFGQDASGKAHRAHIRALITPIVAG